ncbi:hypothetical protein [Endozoicomonas sp. Mp262]|uniref:hypothetical protein n=1 Tax=Endozoicomonas sp. Mp262 TaxID=2919499 RepID=UPI0021DB2FB0
MMMSIQSDKITLLKSVKLWLENQPQSLETDYWKKEIQQAIDGSISPALKGLMTDFKLATRRTSK